jgi:hypothetical protein
MSASPMPRWQTAIALLAVVLAAVALLPLAPGARVLCAGLAGAAILMLLAARLRAHRVRREATRVAGVYDRIERIRADRARRTTSRR